MKWLLEEGRVIDPTQGIDEVMDILVVDGIIAACGKKLPRTADTQTVSLRGKVLCPGFIDMHAYLGEPGKEGQEGLENGTKAAAAGGITTVVVTADTVPVIDKAILVDGLRYRIDRKAQVRVEVSGAVSKDMAGKELAEMGDMVNSGAIAFGDNGHFLQDGRLMRSALKYSTLFDRPILSHAEESSLADSGYMHEGEISACLGLKGKAAEAEEIAAYRDIRLAEMTGGRLHITHVSTAKTVELIREARARGVKVTGEVTPHHLYLGDDRVISFDSCYKVNPPLRSLEHRQALLTGLLDGTLQALVSDHRPYKFEEKDCEFSQAPDGIPGLETSFSLLMTHFVHTGKMSLATLIERMTCGPAAILGLEDRGSLAVGKAADITVLDLKKHWTVKAENLYSKGCHNPYEGEEMVGRPVATMVAGKWIMLDGIVGDDLQLVNQESDRRQVRQPA